MSQPEKQTEQIFGGAQVVTPTLKVSVEIEVGLWIPEYQVDKAIELAVETARWNLGKDKTQTLKGQERT